MKYAVPRSQFRDIAWPSLPLPIPTNLFALQFQFDRSERFPPEVLRQQQFRQLRTLAAHAYGTAPFQARRLHEAGYRQPEDLERIWDGLALTTRRDVRERGERMFAASIPKEHGQLLSSSTSGSTGTPIVFRKTGLCQIMWNAFGLRELRWHGLDPAHKLALIRRVEDGSADWPAGTRSDNWGTLLARAYTTGPAAILDITTPLERQIEWLQREAPQSLATFPSNLAALARHAIDHGIALPGLRHARTFGEILTPRVRALCRRAWDVPVIDCYSAEETGFMALQCPSSEAYHVMAEGVLIEVLDDDGRACGPGEIGRLVVTSLHNFAMPFLRYEIGDYAEVGEPCGCGRTLPVLKRIIGRSRQRILLPTGGRQFAHNPSEVFAGIEAILQYQIVQRRVDRLEVNLVARRRLLPEEERQIAEALAVAFRYPFPIDFTYLQAIPRSKRGKFEDIRSELAERL